MTGNVFKPSKSTLNPLKNEAQARESILPGGEDRSFLRGFSATSFYIAPQSRARWITSIFIAGHLLWQLALPLSYYLGDDKSDERFAWRMFSVVYYLQDECGISFAEWRPGSPLRPWSKEEREEKMPSEWREFFVRDRAAVVKKFLASYCLANPAVKEIQLIRLCMATNRVPETMERVGMICPTGELKRDQRGL